MARVIKICCVLCAAALFLGVFQQVSAKSKTQPVTAAGFKSGFKSSLKSGLPQQQLMRVSPANVNNETGAVQGNHSTRESVQPGIYFGLAASLAGALIMGLSFLVLQRQRP
jgi:hypothetical protein